MVVDPPDFLFGTLEFLSSGLNLKCKLAKLFTPAAKKWEELWGKLAFWSRHFRFIKNRWSRICLLEHNKAPLIHPLVGLWKTTNCFDEGLFFYSRTNKIHNNFTLHLHESLTRGRRIAKIENFRFGRSVYAGKSKPGWTETIARASGVQEIK